MDTRIEATMARGWEVISAHDGKTIGFVHEGSDGGKAFELGVSNFDRVSLADLNGRRYPSLSQLAKAIGDHLKGDCKIT